MNSKANPMKNTPKLTHKSQSSSSKGNLFADFVQGLEKYSKRGDENINRKKSKGPCFFKNYHQLQSHTAYGHDDPNFYSDSHLQKEISQRQMAQEENKENSNTENRPALAQTKLPKISMFTKKSDVTKNLVLESP